MIEFVDTTIRDGNQSLWSATGLTTPDVLAIAPTLDRVGYHALDFTSSTHMAVSVRFHKEDPWERLRLVSAAMPETPLGMIGTGMRFISWVPAAEDLMALSFRVAVRNGLRRFQIADPSNDPERIRRIAAMARREGIEQVVVGLTYSISPVHTHAYYAQRAAALADCADIDRLYLKDPGGLLTPDAVRELAPHFLAAAGDAHRRAAQPLHDRAGAARLRRGRTRRLPGRAHGVRAAVARDLAAGGPQHGHEPRGRRIRTPARPRGAGGRDGALRTARGATRACRPVRRRSSTAPTTAISSRAGWSRPRSGCSRRSRRPELYEQVLEEVTRVRAEMGYPIIVTPVSQFIASQAARNVIDGERWKVVSDETIRYFWGHYGEPPAPVDQDVAERVLSQPRRRSCVSSSRSASRAHVRASGARISDEELLLRLTMPAEQVDAMVARRRAERTAPDARSAAAGLERPAVVARSERLTGFRDGAERCRGRRPRLHVRRRRDARASRL